MKKACSALAAACLLAFTAGAISARAQTPAKPAADARDSGEFFIVWSVDSGKNQMLLKLPTEVTEVVRVDDKTRYFDAANKPINLNDLRAGDTIFITFSGGKSRIAQRIRKGPMTVEELHRRYLAK